MEVDPISFMFAGALVLLILCLQFSIALTTAWGQRKIMMPRIAFLEERMRTQESANIGTTMPRSSGEDYIAS